MATNKVVGLLITSFYYCVTMTFSKEASCSFDIWTEALNLYQECVDREKIISELYHATDSTKLDQLCKNAEIHMNDCRKKTEGHLKDCKDPTKDALIEEYLAMSVGYLNHPCDKTHQKLEGIEDSCELKDLQECLTQIRSCYKTRNKLTLLNSLSSKEIEQECTDHYNTLSECHDIEERCLKQCWTYDQKLLIRAYEDMDWHSLQELCTNKGKVLYEFFQQNGSKCFEAVLLKAEEKGCGWEKATEGLNPYNAPEKCIEVMLKMDCSNAPIHYLTECKNVNTRLIFVYIHTHFWDPVCFRPLGRRSLDEGAFGFRSFDDGSSDIGHVTLSNWQSVYITFIFSIWNLIY